MKFILGQKREMSQIYVENNVIPVTAIETGDCKIVQVKTIDSDGYEAIQVGFLTKKNINKPAKGHCKGLGNFKHLKEFRSEKNEFKIGDILDINSFEVGDKVQVTGSSKGKGFQGVVKRHGFHGAPASHGTKDQLRMPGSIGATGPAHVFKGTKMGGQMGNQQSTAKGLEIIEIDKENNLIKVKGAIPGARNSLVAVSCDGEMKIIENKKPDKVNSGGKESDLSQKTADKKQENKDSSNQKIEKSTKQEDIKKEEKKEDKK
ncbi:50S ribosomal protein L3 [Candidatus Falkowbacteria bacterium]|jgi:large subunit ribosomal protein L3|nr:50S ribosomal protein L3 [Candidatus Falkowbacteria bacterium]MBT4432994.1 50S ribosomal protein L3 [Candidatus Falkowbacteria bacterium]